MVGRLREPLRKKLEPIINILIPWMGRKDGRLMRAIVLKMFYGKSLGLTEDQILSESEKREWSNIQEDCKLSAIKSARERLKSEIWHANKSYIDSIKKISERWPSHV
jgi:hypothetical protein